MFQGVTSLLQLVQEAAYPSPPDHDAAAAPGVPRTASGIGGREKCHEQVGTRLCALGLLSPLP